MILKIPHIPKYEPHYRMAWEIQNKKDADNKKCMLFSNKKLVDAQYKNAKKGAIRREAKQKEMPEQVKIINRMLKNHMTQSTIASILGISQNAVSKAKSRYSLPKEEFLKL